MCSYLANSKLLKFELACQNGGNLKKWYEITCKICSCRIFIRMFQLFGLNLDLPWDSGNFQALLRLFGREVVNKVRFIL